MLRRGGLRVRIAIVAGLVLALGAVPAWAFWSAQRTVPAQRFDLGTLDVQLDGQDATATVAFAAGGAMYPGSSSVSTVVVKNNGTVPLSYWLTVTGTAQTRGMADALDARSTTGTPSGGTCGGTQVGSATPIGTGAAKVLAYGPAATSRRQVLPGASETLCVQLTLTPDAPDAVQGGSGTLLLTAHAAQVGAP